MLDRKVLFSCLAIIFAFVIYQMKNYQNNPPKKSSSIQIEKNKNTVNSNTNPKSDEKLSLDEEKLQEQIQKEVGQQMNLQELTDHARSEYNLDSNVIKDENGQVVKIEFIKRIPAEVMGPSPVFPLKSWQKNLQPKMVQYLNDGDIELTEEDRRVKEMWNQ